MNVAIDPRRLRRRAQGDLPYQTVALVLQGGGALASYQAGVYEGLDEAGVEPNWLTAVSIGAINAAVIGGNPRGQRVAKLQALWDTISRPSVAVPGTELFQQWLQRAGEETRKWFGAVDTWRTLLTGQAGFFIPRIPPPWLAFRSAPDKTSYYDASALKATLESLVDFDRINAGHPRVTLAAVNVRTGRCEHFDNTVGRWRSRLRAEHFLAACALPPGFAPIDIDGDFYWDASLVANTPLARVLHAWPRPHTLAFEVDLWSATGHVPSNIWNTFEREKQIVASSRALAVTDLLKREQKLRHLLHELLDRLPAAARDEYCCREAKLWASDRLVNVIRLVYRDKPHGAVGTEFKFEPVSVNEHWARGLDDTRRSLAHDEWLQPPRGGRNFLIHDLHREAAPENAE